jgi:hypothetical protein
MFGPQWLALRRLGMRWLAPAGVHVRAPAPTIEQQGPEVQRARVLRLAILEGTSASPPDGWMGLYGPGGADLTRLRDAALREEARPLQGAVHKDHTHLSVGHQRAADHAHPVGLHKGVRVV